MAAVLLTIWGYGLLVEGEVDGAVGVEVGF